IPGPFSIDSRKFQMSGSWPFSVDCRRLRRHPLFTGTDSLAGGRRGRCSMTQDRGLDGRNAARAPLQRRNRRRWSVAGGVAAAWLVLYLIAGSALSATMLLVAFAATGAIAALFLRSMGVTRDHPRIRQLASRPWRDGQAVLQVAMSHLHDVFVITPSGSLF